MRRLRSGIRGLTLMEVLVSAGILIIVLGGSLRLMTVTSNVYNESSVRSAATFTANRAVQEVAHFILGAAPGSISGPVNYPGAWSDQITFDELEGVNATTGVATWKTCRITFQYAPGETNNGLDDDRNGLADDGEVELITDYGGPWASTIQLFRNVREYAAGESPNGADDNGNGLIDEKGLSFQRVGNSIVVRLTVTVPDGKGRFSSETAQTTVSLRNR